ncbi:MAG: glycosyltransferase family 4 protein [Hyphomicrobiaceae bacterium]|nr:glycosyltransferase family 4 protein [Hyphomicrobiaceae bacterium]
MLLINFAMDRSSPVLPWQAAVADALVERAAAVHVVTEWLGDYVAPSRLTLDAIPRRPLGVPRRVGGLWLAVPRVVRAIERFRPNVCFVHMAHEWCYRIGPYLRARGIPILLWYAHGAVPWKLHVSAQIATRIVTSTPEGFRIQSPKKRVIGQAIDTALFDVPADRRPAREIVTVGRISRRKNLALLIEAMAKLVNRPELVATRLRIVGPELTADDRVYRAELDTLVARRGLEGMVGIEGPMTQPETAALYSTAALHVNVSGTGSMDKTVMEALSAGCPVVTSNVAFVETLAEFPEMLIEAPSPESLAERMAAWLDGRFAAEPGSLRAIVKGRHDLEGYANRIVVELQSLVDEAHARQRAAT